MLKNALLVCAYWAGAVLGPGAVHAEPFGELYAGPPISTLAPEKADRETQRWLMTLPQDDPTAEASRTKSAETQAQDGKAEAVRSEQPKPVVAVRGAPSPASQSTPRRIAENKTVTGRSAVRRRPQPHHSHLIDSPDDPLPARMNPPVALVQAAPQPTTAFPKAQLQSPFGEVLTH